MVARSLDVDWLTMSVMESCTNVAPKRQPRHPKRHAKRDKMRITTVLEHA
jgi:hypothetical protein